MKLLLCSVLCVVFLSGCHMMVGTPSGIREMSRWNNGLITQGKSAPNTPTGYWNNEIGVTKNWGKSYSYTNEEDGARSAEVQGS